MDKFSYLGNSEIDSIEKLYEQYKVNSSSVDIQWQKFFEGFEFAQKHFPNSTQGSEWVDKEFKVINLIDGYRKRGHLFTKTNPVRERRKYSPALAIGNFGLDTEDLEKTFQAGKNIGIGPATLKNIILHLETTYCHSIGAEYMFIRNPEILSWLQNRMESKKNTPEFSNSQKKHIYNHLKQAVGFESFIHRKFVGQKRFSLEGAETLIPAMDSIIEKGSKLGIEEFIIGMAHRGRLNVLANILKKPVENIFSEFLGEEYDETIALGDVKYHLGFENSFLTNDKKTVNIKLVPNPSHLETVGPVVQGISKAIIWEKYNHDYKKLIPVIIHGDAAIASQGVVYETLQMSQLNGYKTGGTIHLVINNQVGFTTNYLEARSSTYCTDIAKVTKSPIFHVNGDDVEALVYTIEMAMEFRQTFHTDVFIDILCYRKYGHNEGDEPRFTQPLLYDIISKHPNPKDIYGNLLINQNVSTKEELKILDQEYSIFLEQKLEIAQKNKKVLIRQFLANEWLKYHHPVKSEFENSPLTGVDKKVLKAIAHKINMLPKDLKFFNKVEKLMNDRNNMMKDEKLDWAMAELLAYGTLVAEGHPVRLSGQDSERGTFSHRHATLTIEDSVNKYIPLKHISEDQAPFHVFNSPLSEYGVLGFEYGFALATPSGLTIWEAQFGDFHNVAQVIIDQYMSSAEDKWGLMNGLTLFLPHGYEGQGPEHSSARIERFLTLSANNNMQIVNATTPANFFHVLRRQTHREFAIPLVIFTPKSLLRHPKCISPLDDLARGSFKEVIDDENVDIQEVRSVVFCSGKIYYDLLEKKEEFNAKDIALVRVEQLHPWPENQIQQIIKKYPQTLRWLWVQEEPENMGAWSYVRDKFAGIDIKPLARLASGSPAVGLHKLHVLGQQEIINKVFRKCTCELKKGYCGLQCDVGSKREEIKQQHTYL